MVNFGLLGRCPGSFKVPVQPSLFGQAPPPTPCPCVQLGTAVFWLVQVWASPLAVPLPTLGSVLQQWLLHQASGRAVVPAASGQPDAHPRRCSAHDISLQQLQPWLSHALQGPTSRNRPVLRENLSPLCPQVIRPWCCLLLCRRCSPS